MADAAAFCAKAPFYILWRLDLWRYAEMPHTYKVTFVIDAVYKKKMSLHTRFFIVYVQDILHWLRLHRFWNH